MKTVAVSLLCLLAVSFSAGASGSSKAVPAEAKHAFGGGERLSYTVSWGAISVLRVSLSTTDENLGGRPHYHVVGNGTTGGMVKAFFSLNDTYHAWLDASTLLPSRMTSNQQEENYRHRATYNYDWNSMTVSTVRRNANWDADRRETFAITPDSGDAVSLFFRLRQTDPATLTPGRAYQLDLVLEESTKPIFYKFHGRERVSVRRIGTFNALKFSCTMATADGSDYGDGMTLTIWISDDGNKIPLLMEAPTRIGKIRVTLGGGYKVLHPLTSLVK